MDSWIHLLEIVAVVVAVLFLVARFMPRLWRVFSISIRIAIFVGATFVALAGSALLMNNETIFAQPGVRARIHRFLTVDHAATSKKGLGSAACAIGQHAATPTHGIHEHSRASKSRSAVAGSADAQQPESDYYPELVTRGYPGIPRSKLFAMAEDSVRSLGGWKVIKADPRSGSLECMYTTRILGFHDYVRIEVTRRNEVELCSRSGKSEPGERSVLRLFPGDFGANIAHIKEFYSAMRSRTNAFYTELQNRQMTAY